MPDSVSWRHESYSVRQYSVSTCPICDSPLRDPRSAASVRYRNRADSYVWTEVLSGNGFSCLCNNYPIQGEQSLTCRYTFSLVHHKSIYFLYRYFDSVDVCKIREGWAEARANGCFPAFAGSPAKIVLVNVFETTEVDLCLFQEGVR